MKLRSTFNFAISARLVSSAAFPRCQDAPRFVNLLTRRGLSLSHEAMLDGRARLSRLWLPTGGIAPVSQEDSHAKLLRAGFLRQAYPGVFHLLPLGRRVLNKLELLIDRHMYNLGASKVELSSISSEDMWSKSGRLASASQELFRFQDRKLTPYLLSPTHEEEITSLVASAVQSHRELPILLYQTSRKYRDEVRPRHGLLRSREFVMKDLYTFDVNTEQALATYHMVRSVYVKLFEELKLPFLVAEANSGDIGGTLSHEFHFPTLKGEDRIISCSACGYTANEELAESVLPDSDALKLPPTDGSSDLQVWRGISKDRCDFINVWFVKSTKGVAEVNIHAVKSLVPQLDTTLESSTNLWELFASRATRSSTPRIINIIDGRLPQSLRTRVEARDPRVPYSPGESRVDSDIPMLNVSSSSESGSKLNVIRIESGDGCPRCVEGTLDIQKAIELGHTFHLGQRYSEPMNAVVSVPVNLLDSIPKSAKPEVVSDSANRMVPFQMGCHGIGVSRIIGAVADTLADERGLNWPRVMAPFEAVIIPTKGLEEAALEVYDVLSSPNNDSQPLVRDLILDDRNLSFPWKAQDADLVGYPTIIVVGRRWKSERKCEVQCRRLGVRADVDLRELRSFINSLLVQL